MPIGTDRRGSLNQGKIYGSSTKHPDLNTQGTWSMTPFFTILCHDLPLTPRLTGACIGYQSTEWRAQQFARHLFRFLPEFCLTHSERKSIDDTNCMEHIANAAKLVYDTDKYQKRGEFGELMLHALLRETRQTEPAISKIFFKDASNNTVKGFDAVHVIDTPNGLELWLGEVKFYKDINTAIRDVIKELSAHFQDNYLRQEFGLIANKLDANWTGSEKLRRLLHENTSLDEVVSAIVVPVLLTYESPTTQAHTSTTPTYKAAIEAELQKHHTQFAAKNQTTHVRIELFLMPMKSKKVLVSELHSRLKLMQGL